MLPDPDTLAARISAETGLGFVGTMGRERDGSQWLELHPAEYAPAQTFALRTVLGWRRLEVYFRPGRFAADLVAAMRSADETGRRAFIAVLEACESHGAQVELTLNGSARTPEDPALWADEWKSIGLAVRRGMLALNEGDAEVDATLVTLWTGRVAAAVLALLPLERVDADESAEPESPEIAGLPEGAKSRIEVNRYERDRRNRAAALAIHGYACKACDLEMALRYGEAAGGLIEVHHVTPVSELGLGYVIDPKSDLVPLCPNCHSVAHRRSPPFSIEELRSMMYGQASETGTS